jgi:alkanesulfonate monooxygenase SsuD/methylene tetrahydromethanopterin reductase-like flavin-dependent oxidoreductase (luciferase family)
MSAKPAPALKERAVPDGIRLVLVMTEQDTLVPPRELTSLVDLCVQAEEAGVDCVMMSEHILLGPTAGSQGRMTNPRDYAAPGNQDPATPWPSSLVMLSAVAARTTRLRLAAAAVIAPLRHPLVLAKEFGTLDLLAGGRLVVLPTVSWHEDEYAALGVPFTERGKILDNHLEVMAKAWGDYPVTHDGPYSSFGPVWLEPGAFAADGPTMWFGGQGIQPALLRRLVRYGHGLNPFGALTGEDLEVVREAFRAAGRDPQSLELVGGIRGRFTGPDDLASLDDALQGLPAQVDAGFRSICVKPSMYLDDPRRFSAWCRDLIARVEDVSGLPVAMTHE